MNEGKNNVTMQLKLVERMGKKKGERKPWPKKQLKELLELQFVPFPLSLGNPFPFPFPFFFFFLFFLFVVWIINSSRDFCKMF